MWTQKETDEMVVHAQDETMKALGTFLEVYFKDRLPTPQEVGDALDIPVELVVESMASGLDLGGV